MTDLELLELAAKAAGIVVIRSRIDDPICRDLLTDKFNGWNPLTDDGDALRLAVRLQLWVNIGPNWCRVESGPGYEDVAVSEIGECPHAATRRAIVRAAAEIGRQK